MFGVGGNEMARGMRRSTTAIVISSRYLPETDEDEILGLGEVRGTTDYDLGYDAGRDKAGRSWLEAVAEARKSHHRRP